MSQLAKEMQINLGISARLNVLNQYVLRISFSVVLVRLGRFMECNGVLPTTQAAYRKGLGTCDAHLSMFHTLQRAL